MPAEMGWVSGGVASFIVAVGLIVKYFLDWQSKRGDYKRLAAEAIANGEEWLIQQLRASLRDERDEVQRLSAEVAELRTQNAALYQQMREQRKDYEREVAGLRVQLADLTAKVEAFQQRLHTDPPV